jgi:4'-phosphopantetheinyl transferase
MPWRSDQVLPPVSARELRQDPGDSPRLLLLSHARPFSPERRSQLLGRLAAEELRRLEAYRRSSDRDLFLLGRSCLRQLLGLWLNQPSTAIRIALGPHGKPFCPDGPRFNLSHSGSLILLGLHPCRSVGVDVERHRPDLAWEPLARRVLAAEELAALLTLPSSEQPSGFLRAWCRLEARLKTRGLGFAGLQALHSASHAPTDHPCTLWDVEVPRGYRAAAALGASP